MGKASSNKKIARAQRAGSKSTAGQQRGWLYPLSITLVFVLGILLVVVARNSRDAVATGPPVANQDHWHAAYAVSICDEFQPPITDETDPSGIHTHGDGVIHIHPFSESVAGSGARLEAFMDASGLVLKDDRISVPGGKEVVEGKDKCGDADAEIRVARWTDGDKADTTDPQIFTENFEKIRFLGDREAITIFYGPADADIPPPDTVGQLDQLTDVAPPTDPSQPGVSVVPDGSVPDSSVPDSSVPDSSVPDPTSTTGG